MKGIEWSACAVLAAVACGTGNLRTLDDVEGRPFDGTNAALRLRGTNNAGYGAALVQIRSLQVKAGDTLLADVAVDSQLDLAKDHAWLLARLKVPRGAEVLDVILVIDDGGGAEKLQEGFAFESPCTTVKVQVPTSLLAQKSRAVLHLDLDRSLVASRAGRLLMPQLSLHR